MKSLVIGREVAVVGSNRDVVVALGVCRHPSHLTKRRELLKGTMALGVGEGLAPRLEGEWLQELVTSLVSEPHHLSGGLTEWEVCRRHQQSPLICGIALAVAVDSLAQKSRRCRRLQC